MYNVYSTRAAVVQWLARRLWTADFCWPAPHNRWPLCG